jgi:hypothetical protein
LNSPPEFPKILGTLPPLLGGAAMNFPALAGLSILALSSFHASAVEAEPVRYEFTGVVDLVSDGTGGSLDLTSAFVPGQAMTFVATVERSTTGYPLGDGTFYLDAITQWSITSGGYVRVLGPAVSSSGIYLENGQCELQIPQPYSPSVGAAIAVNLLLNLLDAEGAAFADEELPRTMAPVDELETATWSLQFSDLVAAGGGVSGRLLSVTTPATTATWGRIKAGYRR